MSYLNHLSDKDVEELFYDASEELECRGMVNNAPKASKDSDSIPKIDMNQEIQFFFPYNKFSHGIKL